MTSFAPRRRYSFGRFKLSVADGRLLDSDATVPLSGRAFDLLLALLESGGQLATKADLLRRVWPNLVVEENTLQVHVSALRKLLGADTIVTVSGRGYRFALNVTATEEESPGEGVANNLPRPNTSFVGRTKETGDVKRLLDRSRILTIIGVGGCGKTRLAIEVATEHRQVMPDGVWFIELAALSQGSQIPQRIAAAVGLLERPDVSILDDLFHRFEAKRALLIFDNVEHLVAPCARVVDALLTRCPKLSILVTSRERLGVLGESTYAVPSLAMPDPEVEASPQSLADCESVMLFTDRARELRPHFSVTVSNAAVLALICQRLDGIPLAIELAAPRLRSMPLEEILERLDRRFSLLRDASNTRIPRQRTLRSLIDWSYELLTPEEQAVFCRTAVFSGGWTLGAAERVCAGEDVATAKVLDILASLVDKNLLSTEQKNGIARYRLLETIRQYALERLRENREDFRHRKALQLSHFVAVSQAAEPEMVGPDQLSWFEQLDADHDNIRASLYWAFGEGLDPISGSSLAGAVWRFWMSRGHAREGREWLGRALAAPEGSHPHAHGKVLNGAGALAYMQADFDAAKVLWEKCLVLRRAGGDKAAIAGVLNNLGIIAMNSGDLDRASALYEESLAIAQDLGEETRVAASLHNLGVIAIESQRYDSAIVLYRRCLLINRRLSNGFGVASDLVAIGLALGHLGRLVDARKWLLQGLEIFFAHGDRWRVATTLSELAWMTSLRGLIDRAARFWGAIEAIRQSVGAPLTKGQQGQYAAELASARARLADDIAFDRCWQEGSAMSWQQAARYAIEPGDEWPEDWHDAADQPLTPHQETSGIHQN